MKTILLDTNAYTHLLSGDESVLNVLSIAETIYMSMVITFDAHFKKNTGVAYLGKFVKTAAT